MTDPDFIPTAALRAAVQAEKRLVTMALDDLVTTLRETADQINREEEFPSLTIDPDARVGYSHACHDLADAIERRSIAGGVLRQWPR